MGFAICCHFIYTEYYELYIYNEYTVQTQPILVFMWYFHFIQIDFQNFHFRDYMMRENM